MTCALTLAYACVTWQVTEVEEEARHSEDSAALPRVDVRAEEEEKSAEEEEDSDASDSSSEAAEREGEALVVDRADVENPSATSAAPGDAAPTDACAGPGETGHSHGGGDNPPEEASIIVGDRMHIPREEENQSCIASIIAVKIGGPTVVTYDDMLWAAFPTDDLLELLRQGKVWKVAECDDVAIEFRARAFLRPFNGAPPHSFLFGESTLGET